MLQLKHRAMHYEIQGIKLPHDKDVISKNIKNSIQNGSYEREESEQLKKILQDGERILEIGGGIGYISSLAAKSKQVEKKYVLSKPIQILSVTCRLFIN